MHPTTASSAAPGQLAAHSSLPARQEQKPDRPVVNDKPEREKLPQAQAQSGSAEQTPGARPRYLRPFSYTRCSRDQMDASLARLRKRLRTVPGGALLSDKASLEELLRFAVTIPHKTLNRVGWTESQRTVLMVWLIRCGADVKTEALKTAMVRAVACGYEAVAAILLDAGVDPATTDHHGNPLLLVAAGHGDLQLVLLLLEKGAKLDARNATTGYTALHWAAKRGHSDVVRLLLRQGIGVDLADKDGRTPLNVAARHGQVKVAAMLIDAGANIHRSYPSGHNTIVLDALIGEHTGILKLLMTSGVDICRHDARGHTLLMSAVMWDRPQWMPCLLELGSKMEARDREGRTALHHAMGGRLDRILSMKLLLDAGANTEARDAFGQTPLLYAASVGRATGVGVLIAYGADINAVTPDGCTALQFAMKFGNLNTVRVLAERGARLNPAAGVQQAQALQNHPTIEGAEEILKRQIGLDKRIAPKQLEFMPYELLRATLYPVAVPGAKLPARAPNLARLCLSLACGKCSAEGLKSAIALAADINIPLWYRQKLGEAFALARVCGHYPELKKLASSLGAHVGGTYKAARALFQTTQKNIDRHQSNGYTLLTQAAAEDDLLMVQVLASLGADLHIRDNEWNTAVLTAARKANFAVFTELVSLGANADDEDAKGCSTLYFLARALTETDHSQAIMKLLRYLQLKGYHFDHPNPDARSPQDPPTLADMLVQAPEKLIKGLVRPWLEEHAKASPGVSPHAKPIQLSD